MGIVQVGAATTGGSATGSIVLTKPTGVASGDVLVAFISNTLGSTVAITAPSGFASIRSDNDGASGNIQIISYYKVAGASEPTSYTFTVAGAWSGAGQLTAWNGVDNTTTVDKSNGTPNSTSASSITAPAVVNTGSADMLLAAYEVYNGGAVMAGTVVVTLPGSLTAQGGTVDSGDNTLRLCVGSQLLSASGSTGTRVGTIPVTENYQCGQMVTLLAAGGAAVNKPIVGQLVRSDIGRAIQWY